MKPSEYAGILTNEVAELERRCERAEGLLGEINANLHANYGDNGGTIPGLIEKEASICENMLKVLRHYHNKRTDEENNGN